MDAGIPVVQCRSYRNEEAAQALSAESADLGVLAFVTQIIPVAILDSPRLASVCFHPSLLPAYRGGSAINWQLINGETLGGLTLFRPNDGIDSGPIYLQRSLPIGADDTAASYYYQRVFEPGVEATLEAVEDLLCGRASCVAQDEARATHDPLCRAEHAAIDWNRGAEALHNLVRGCDPSPGAHCVWKGTRIRLYGSRRSAGGGAEAPGTVLGLDDDGMEVAVADGSLRFAKISYGELGKGVALELAAEIGISIGGRLENGVIADATRE